MDQSNFDTSNINFVSVHIPKTAGSTFGHVFLQKLYCSEEIFYDYEFLPLDETLKKIEHQVKVIHGHFPAKKYLSVFPQSKYVVWLRHPFKQLLSWYAFWSAPPNNTVFDEDHRKFLESKMSFREFIEMPYARNSFSSFYLEGANLEEFFFVGIQEFFTEDLEYFKSKVNALEINVPDFTNINANPNYAKLKKELSEDRALIDRLTSLNSGDLALYEVALSIRSGRLSQYAN